MKRSEYLPLNFCELRFSTKYWLNYLRTAEETCLELQEFLTPLLQGKRHQNITIAVTADPGGRAAWDVGLRALASWDCEFESCRWHECLSVVSVVCCQVEVCAPGWSHVQRSPTACGMTAWMWLWNLDSDGPWHARVCCAMGKRKDGSHTMQALRSIATGEI
jgi:hypothetical protein